MKTEEKVCTKEKSERLVELGIDLKTEKHWVKTCRGKWFICQNNEVDFHLTFADERIHFPAPDVPELGRLLGKYTCNDYTLITINYSDDMPDGESTGYECFFGRDPVCYFSNEAEARCAALIWLIENEHLKPGDCKL
jgi:hypothetical protein